MHDLIHVFVNYLSVSVKEKEKKTHEKAFVFAATQFCFYVALNYFCFLFSPISSHHLHLPAVRYFRPPTSPTPLHCNAAPSPIPRPLPYCRGQLPGRVRRQPRRLVPVRWSRGREASRPSGVSDGARRRNCSPDLIIATMKVSVVGTVMDGQALLYRHTIIAL